MPALTMEVLKNLPVFSSKEQLRQNLSTVSLPAKATLLRELIEQFDSEVELEILSGNIELAMYKLSQMAIAEDELTLVDRLLVKHALRSL